MRIQQLEYLSKIAETVSITQAAKDLYISQPSLSNAMKELEKEMNIVLFHRSHKGITLTREGEEFLAYARQVLEQVELMNRRYKENDVPKQIFSVASQHYAFVVEAFVKLLKALDAKSYQATLKELRTYEVLADIANLKSELGIIYLSNYNRQVITGVLREKHLSFIPLHVAKPHVFLYKNHPLAAKGIVTFDDLAKYPKLSYEQGHFNSFYFWEEVLADCMSQKSIIVSDRATLFNLLIGLDGYTISSGIINTDLNGENIITCSLNSTEQIEIGYVINDYHRLSKTAIAYVNLLKECLSKRGSI
ncbi:MAG: LysR family transcriptional regulator [Lactobacillales bacterium]|nr:LysR family transcriptional regulator [Lactobacillales bacterium]